MTVDLAKEYTGDLDELCTKVIKDPLVAKELRRALHEGHGLNAVPAAAAYLTLQCAQQQIELGRQQKNLGKTMLVLTVVLIVFAIIQICLAICGR